jgi:Ca2+-binding RTX toxin-like protein
MAGADFRSLFGMVLRYPELTGGTGNEAINSTTYTAMLGLQGHDDFRGVSSLAIGGSGNDYYYIGAPEILTIMDRSGLADAVVATAIDFSRITTRAITLDSRHLFLFDTQSSQAMVLLDWQQPANHIETFVLSGVTYSYDQFAANVAGFGRYEGSFTWEGAQDAGYFLLGPEETTPALNESLDFYRAKSIALEQPVILVTNNDAGSNETFAAIPYSGPVTRLDLQFIGSEQSEAILGTAFSDFINSGGGNDAIDGGMGDDVIDGGTGSNFLTGGAGQDTFFLDGRGGTTTWSTITDWQPGEQLSLWGWLPGISTASWVVSDGTPGWTGATLHADLNGDGVVETSVTWTGRSQADLPAPKEFDGVLWFVQV